LFSQNHLLAGSLTIPGFVGMSRFFNLYQRSQSLANNVFFMSGISNNGKNHPGVLPSFCCIVKTTTSFSKGTNIYFHILRKSMTTEPK
jgi:hypothetical protein